LSIVSEAALEAAERHGEDGRGRDGLRGYFVFLGLNAPNQFVRLLKLGLEFENAEQRQFESVKNSKDEALSAKATSEFKGMTLEQKKALLNEWGVQTS